MSIRDRYIQTVRDQVLASSSEWAELEAELRSHFAAGKEAGRADAQTVDRLGSAEEFATSFMAERQLRYGGFWIRALAFGADVGVLLAATLPFLAILVPLGERLERGGWSATLPLIPFVLGLLGIVGLWIIYFPLCEARFGKTLGKHLLGLRAVQESGISLTAGKALLRRLPLYLDIFAIDALVAPFTKKKQRAFDLVAKTVVVHEPGASSGAIGYLLAILCILIPVGAFVAVACGTSLLS